MALTEKYVTVAGAGAHDGSTEGNAWTFAEMISAAPAAGTRVNMKAGEYSIGATTLPAGTAAAPLVIRGYNSTIGDLDNLGRAADGTLVTTNMPDVTITSAWTPANYNILQNLDITASLSTAVINSTTVDRQGMVSCRVVNTANNSGAKAIVMDDGCVVLNCDFDCTGASHGAVAAISNNSTIHNCRFHSTASAVLLSTTEPILVNCLFYGQSTSTGVEFVSTSGGGGATVIGCTFQGIGTAVTIANSANTGLMTFINNICTDGTKWVDNLYAGTATMVIVEAWNRTRDVTTLLTGLEGISIGAVTEDGGGPETDYENVSLGNFRLISSSPAKGVAGPAYMDMGMYQRQEPAGGGGGGSWVFGG